MATRWPAPLAIALILAAVRLATPDPVGGLLGFVGAGAAAVVLFRRARGQAGRGGRMWRLLAVAVVCGATSMLLATIGAFGIVRDVFEFGAYAIGLTAIARYARETGPADADAWLDSSTVGIALGALLFDIGLLRDGSAGSVDQSLLLPVAAATIVTALFAVLARFVIRTAFSRTVSVLCLAMGAVIAVDAVYLGVPGSLGRAVHEAIWFVGYGVWAAAALSPEVETLLAAGPQARHSFLSEVQTIYRSLVMHLTACLVTAALILHNAVWPRGPGVVLLFVALAVQTVVAGTRSYRVIRRLEVDTGQRIATEGQLRESEERFRRLAEAAPVGIFVTDTEGRAVFENEAWGRVVGRDPGSGRNRAYADAVHPDDRDAVMAVWEEGVSVGTSVSTEHRMLRPDGSVAWVSVRSVRMAGPDNRPSGWIGTVADITSLKEATAASEEREAFFNGLIEQSPIGIGVYGPDGSLLDFNPAKRRMRERIGAPLDVPDVRSDPLLLQLGQLDAIERAYAGELAADTLPVPVSPTNADGSGEAEPVWLRFRWYPLRDAEDRVLAVISFAEDVSDAVSAEVRQRRVGEKLQEAAKLEALGVLAGGIAHDFNNLLVPIIGYVDLALAAVPSGSTLAADLEAARTAAGRAADLARQMLAYSGRSSFAIEPVVLEDLLGEIGALMSRSIAKGANLRYEFTPGLPPVLADATELRQVALNLIVNASDALGDRRGEITLRTAMATLEPDDPDVIQGAAAPAGDYVMLEVSDTGGGMDRATLIRIFDPFFSTKSRGRGLGLAATMGIVKGHGGTIRVRSVPGEGSTFQVLLQPTEVRDAEQPTAVEGSGGQAPAGRVLLVDDEPSVRQIGRRILERAGFTVDEAADGPEALERFSTDPGTVDCVLLDLTLPTVDGLTILRELRALRPDLPVVLCSGWSAEEVAERLHHMPRTKFLQKPYQGQALVEAMSGVLLMPAGEA